VGWRKAFFSVLACTLALCLFAACAASTSGPAEGSELGGLTRIAAIESEAAGTPAAFYLTESP